MAKVTQEDLQRQGEAIAALAKSIENEKDGAKIVAVAEQLQRMGQQLNAMATEFEAENAPKDETGGMVLVKLTPEQIERVREKTGETVETVLIPDPNRLLSDRMPMATPDEIEPYAIHEGRRIKGEREAKAAMEKEMARIRAQLESQPNLRDAMERIMAQLRADMESKK